MFFIISQENTLIEEILKKINQCKIGEETVIIEQSFLKILKL